MSAHKNIDRVCVIAIVLSVLLSFVLLNSEALGMVPSAKALGYEDRLFDAAKVHTMDIVIDDWDGFLTTCQSEEYANCAVVIDGEAYKNVAIRGKGNTSLSSVASMDSSRYSFKLEFDHFDNKNYYGLDKLCLNNIIQDNSYMKDFLTYQLMASFGVNTPFCSYTYLTVNGEDWGLYLAVEGVEDGFLERNYGSDSGALYKPDSMSFGGGRGNGKDFNMDDFQMPDGMKFPGGASSSDDSEGTDGTSGMTNPFGGQMPGGFDAMTGATQGDAQKGDFSPPDVANGKMGDMPGGFGMGSSDVKLQYIDDDVDSYSNIFSSAKTDISKADQNRLISSLKSLSENEDLEEVLDIETVLRYFVVHNFVCNGDSYTGSMIHNYYLYEEDGQLSMIPWDYNLAYGTFQSSDATAQVNSPIDTPVSGDMSDRPMVNWIFENETYTEQYHALFAAFLAQTDLEAFITETAEMIAPYVEKDPTKFCTCAEFEAGVSAIKGFCALREESVQGQLDGTIPSTSDGQSADDSALIDASDLNLSDMGTMGGGMGKPDFSGQTPDSTQSGTDAQAQQPKFVQTAAQSDTQGNTPQGGMQPPAGFDGQPPEGFDGKMPEGFDGAKPQTTVRTTDEQQSGTTTETTGTGADDTSTKNTFPANGQMPDFGNMQAPQGSTQSSGSNRTAYILLGISAAVLGIGLLFAFRFKR